MICFRDRAYCSSDCINTECSRHFGDEDWEAAKKWWGSDNNVPIAYTDFKTGCKDYIPPKGKEKELVQSTGLQGEMSVRSPERIGG